MSSSKLVWSSPEINRNRRIKDARILNDSSLRSIKVQFYLFLLVLFEIKFSLCRRLLGIDKPYLYLYGWICKTIFTVNILFLLCYAIQILQAKFILLTTDYDSFQSLLKKILSTLIPNFKLYSEKLMESKWVAYILTKNMSEEEKERFKQLEDRRKLLTKSYFPSMSQQNYVDPYRMHDSVSLLALNRDKSNDSFYYTNNANNFPFLSPSEFDINKHAQSSTPFNHLKVPAAINFGGSITPIQSPFQDFKYQPSTPSPARLGSLYSPGTSFSSKAQSGGLMEIPANEIWKRLGIDPRLLNDWTFSLRQWIHGTIVVRVVAEIDNINARLREMGITDVAVGESNVQTLRQLANQPANRFPTLATLINFLDCSRDQGYVVNRLREFAQGGSLGKYQWDSGSISVRHAWREHLPNDTMLLLHLICTYIETKFAVHSNLHGVRTFSQQFISSDSHIVFNKDVSELKDTFLLYQSSVQPPHFKVVFDQCLYEIPPGRNNLLHCLLIFFHKIYHNEGNFKWINLGRSGMNINFIFDQ